MFQNQSSGGTYQKQEISCNWNRLWSPNDELELCVWVQCINPPQARANFITHCYSVLFSYFQPPKNTNLKPNWAGEPVEFGAHVTYSCDSDENHFEADFNQTAWAGATCLPGGDWQMTGTWPRCLESKVLGSSGTYLLHQVSIAHRIRWTRLELNQAGTDRVPGSGTEV